MTTKNIFIILLTFISFSALGQQEQSEDAGLPKLTDIIGFWKKVNIFYLALLIAVIK